nr:hypothetical protein [Tanacetum cinerariifolium]
MEYAPIVYQQTEFSPPDIGLVVPVFQMGDDPIDEINHMMSFLTAVVTSRLVVPVFQMGDDSIDEINHMMSFLTAVVTSRYLVTNNQFRTSSNLRQQATINNGREEELEFLADPGIAETSSTQYVITNNAAYQA